MSLKYIIKYNKKKLESGRTSPPAKCKMWFVINYLMEKKMKHYANLVKFAIMKKYYQKEKRR